MRVCTWWKVEEEEEGGRVQEVECLWMVGRDCCCILSRVVSLVTCRVNFDGFVISGDTHLKLTIVYQFDL